MRASVHIDFPGWTKEGLDALKKRCNELSLQPRGTRGESGGQTGKRNCCLIYIKFLESVKTSWSWRTGMSYCKLQYCAQ